MNNREKWSNIIMVMKKVLEEYEDKLIYDDLEFGGFYSSMSSLLESLKHCRGYAGGYDFSNDLEHSMLMSGVASSTQMDNKAWVIYNQLKSEKKLKGDTQCQEEQR